jgi:hypothetical protein
MQVVHCNLSGCASVMKMAAKVLNAKSNFKKTADINDLAESIKNKNCKPVKTFFLSPRSRRFLVSKKSLCNTKLESYMQDSMLSFPHIMMLVPSKINLDFCRSSQKSKKFWKKQNPLFQNFWAALSSGNFWDLKKLLNC